LMAHISGALPMPIEWLNWCSAQGLNVVWMSPQGEETDTALVPALDYSGWSLQPRKRSGDPTTELVFREATSYPEWSSLHIMSRHNEAPLRVDNRLLMTAGQLVAALPTYSVLHGGIIVPGEDWTAYMEHRSRQ